MKTADGISFPLKPFVKVSAGRDLYILIWPDHTPDDEFEVRLVPNPLISPEGTVYWYKDGRPSSFGKLNKHQERYVLMNRIVRWQAEAKPNHIPYTCSIHKPAHQGLLSLEPYEVAWRNFLDEMGWTRRHGYCYLHYLPHTREQWVKHEAPNFGEGI